MAAFSGGGHNVERQTEARRAARQVKIYDFARPDKFSREQLRALQIIHSKYARRLGTSLTTQLRSSVRVELVSVDQGTYEEYSKSIPSPSVVAVLNMAPLPGKAILEINPNIAFAVIDRITGGRGESGDKLRELTDIEKALLTKIYQIALHDYEESWKDLINLSLLLEGVTSTMLFTQVASPGDMVMVASCEIKLANTTGMMSVCVPVATIEPVISKLSTELCMGGAKRNTSDESTEDLTQNLSRMPMTCSAILGSTTVTIGDLVNLAAGDVVRLNTNIRSDLTFAVGEHRKFYCKPGLVGSRLAVQITKVDDDAAGTEVA